MNKVLVSAVFAISLIASGSAFAASDIDESIYSETPTATTAAAGFMPSNTLFSAATAALYSETASSVVASVQSADRFEQFADSGIRPVLPE